MDILTLEDEIIVLSQNVGHQTPNDKAPYCRRTETSTAQLQKFGNSKDVPYILKSNPHPNLIQTRFCRFLKRKKKLVRGSNPQLLQKSRGGCRLHGKPSWQALSSDLSRSVA